MQCGVEASSCSFSFSERVSLRSNSAALVQHLGWIDRAVSVTMGHALAASGIFESKPSEGQS